VASRVSCTWAFCRMTMDSPGDIWPVTLIITAGAARAEVCWEMERVPAALVWSRAGRAGVT